MREIVTLSILAIVANLCCGVYIQNEKKYVRNSKSITNDIEQELIKNITAIFQQSDGRIKSSKNEIKEMLKQPQIPPINGDPVEAITSRIPCECKGGICSCCIGGFFFNNKGCMKIRYIPEDFAFELRMTFNNNVLYKNTMSGKNPRPVCISPPRIGWLEMCAQFHDIYFVGRNMHICLDVTATVGDFELVDRQFDCMKFGTEGVALVSPEEGGGHPGYPAVINTGTDAEIDAGGTDDVEEYDEVLG